MKRVRWTRTMATAVTVSALLGYMTPLRAQLVSLKTVPVAAGDQFLLFPSENLGMGGVSIALDDALMDPFVNPAKGGRVSGSFLFGSPAFYSISNDNGSGKTLPIGGLFASERWFGGIMASLQQLESAERQQWLWRSFSPESSQPLSEASANNLYAFGMLGTKIPDKGLSFGASLFLGGLEAVDGVDLLYAMSQRIEQSGSVADFRLGMLKEWEGDRSLEVLLLYDRIRMTHEVTYLDWVWDPEDPTGPQWMNRMETNLDRTNTWGLHLGYVQPLTDTGWRIGGILTGNVKSHPKIPNYEIQNIPRDPGDSWAYNFGVGLSRTHGPATYGVDVIYEPIWSDTWAETDTAMVNVHGNPVPAGGKTVENDFRFSNALVRLGIAGQYSMGGFQIGLQVRSIRYELEQYDHIQAFAREQKESWMEWTPTWGLSFDGGEFQLRYMGRTTTGSGRPGVEWNAAVRGAMDQFAAAEFIVAPSGPLTLQDARVTTHQISVSVPIR
jgi:hypothetical protein